MSGTVRLLRYLLPHRARLAATAACMVLLAVTTAVYAFMVGPMLAFLVTGDHKSVIPARLVEWFPSIVPETVDRGVVLTVLPIGLVTVAVVKGVAYAGQFYLVGSLGQLVVAQLRKQLFSRLMAMSPSFFARRQTGDLLSRFTVDTANVELAITQAVASYLRDTLQVVVLLAQAFALDWRLSLLAFGAFPVTLFPVVRFARWLKRVTIRSNEALGKVSSVAHEAVSGVRVVQAFGMEGHEQRRFDAAVEAHVAVMRRSLTVRGLSTPTFEILAVVGLAAAIVYAGGAISTGGIDGRTFLSFAATCVLLYQPAKSLGRVGTFMLAGVAGAERVFEILDAPNDITEKPDAKVLSKITTAIRFDDVTFGYDAGGTHRDVLKALQLEIRKGEIVAIVGASGAGKTTILNLVPRFFDPVGGSVRIDGVDLRDVTLASLRALVAVVTQDPLLFNETVAANIGYGRPGASRAEVEQAARAADAHDFIAAMPQGYETVIGERGST